MQDQKVTAVYDLCSKSCSYYQSYLVIYKCLWVFEVFFICKLLFFFLTKLYIFLPFFGKFIGIIGLLRVIEKYRFHLHCLSYEAGHLFCTVIFIFCAVYKDAFLAFPDIFSIANRYLILYIYVYM